MKIFPWNSSTSSLISSRAGRRGGTVQRGVPSSGEAGSGLRRAGRRGGTVEMGASASGEAGSGLRRGDGCTGGARFTTTAVSVASGLNTRGRVADLGKSSPRQRIEICEGVGRREEFCATQKYYYRHFFIRSSTWHP